MIAPDRPRRSALFLPASNARALAKTRTLPTDVVILDLEDAVAPDAKVEARLAALEALRQGGFGEREVAIRVNGLDTPWGADDLAAIAGSGADAVLVPKIAGPADIDGYQALLASAPERLQLWTMIETAASVARLDSIGARAADTRLSLWVMGTNDLAKDMRARLTPERAAFLGIFSLAVAAARAHGLAILDSVCNDFRNHERIAAEAEQGRLFGFDGKSLIHPDQIAPCNRAFSPTQDEISWASSVVGAFALPENAGKGAVNVNGAMVELLHLGEAQRVLAIAERIAAMDGRMQIVSDAETR